jgi:thiamine biosynthesis protein ThiI
MQKEAESLIYLIRYSEIFLKSDYVRKKWEDRLIQNIRKVLPVKIKRERGRIFLYIDPETPDVESKLRKIFGIVSFSRVIKCKLHDLEKEVLEYCKEKIIQRNTFAVRVKRVGSHEFTSQEKAAEIGGAILKAFPHLKVDLKNPEFTLYVEIRNDDCYIFSEIFKGAGGIPLGVEGKVVSLLSGGIDSPVASFMMMKRGCEVLPLHFDLGEFGEGGYEKAVKVAEVLRQYQPDFEIEVVDHASFMRKAVEIMKKEKKLNYTCLVCKRRMYRVAEEYAEKNGALGIVTGESLGQVASQTLDNLYVLSRACKMPVYRPLIGMDKIEIEKIAMEIGTFEYSKLPSACMLTPPKPSTKGKLKVVEKLEEKIYQNLD